jgi:hypothetical protein
MENMTQEGYNIFMEWCKNNLPTSFYNFTLNNQKKIMEHYNKLK